MKILLTGASGLLGSAFAEAATRRKHEVVGLVGSYQDTLPHLATRHTVDLRDPVMTERFVLEQFPDAIVNCAAISSPLAVEKEIEESYRINVLLPEQLAQLSRHLFATFIHISSEQVFDGTAAIYKVTDTPKPPNTYGRQKAESEQRVADAASEFATTIRVPLLNGNSPRGNRGIHESLMRNWAQGRKTSLFEDEFRQPCLVGNLANAMVELCERNDIKGTVHWAGSQLLSRYAIGMAITRHFGLPEDLVQPSLRAQDPTTALRQERLALDLQPLAAKLKTQPQSFEAQLDSLSVPRELQPWYNAI